MKIKSYIYAAAIVAMAACSSDDLAVEQNGGGNNNGTVGEEVEAFTSTITDNYIQLGEEDMDNGTFTRAGVNTETFAATWDVGDEVCISDGTLIFSYDVESTSADGETCKLVVKDNHKAFSTDKGFHAIYPRRAVTECEGGKWEGNVVTAQVFAQQSYSENTANVPGHNNHYFGGYYVTKNIAGFDPSTPGVYKFSFMPLCSVIDVDLSDLVLDSGDQIAGVYVKDNDGHSLAGHFEYNYATKKIKTLGLGECPYNFSSRSDVVEVNFFHQEVDGVVSYDKIKTDDKTVRFYVLPIKLAHGVTISIRTLKGKYYSKKSSTAVGSEEAPFEMDNDATNMGSIAKPYYKKYRFGSASTAKMGAWMACLPNNIYFNMLSIPGTHDSATSGLSTQIGGKCQNWTIAQQLENGVRAFDLRPAASSPENIHHGIINTGVKFSDALAALTTFLQNNPTETLFAFIHMEKATLWDISDAEKLEWSYSVYPKIKDLVDNDKALDALNTNTKLTDCLGKIIFVWRDDLTCNEKVYNACKIPWNDNVARTVYVQNTAGTSINGLYCSYQDIYEASNLGTTEGNVGYDDVFVRTKLSNVNDKTAVVKNFIRSAVENYNDEKKRLVLNFASWADGTGQTLEANPISNAADIILGEALPYIVQQHERVGIIFSDFVDRTYGSYTVPQVVLSNNFKHCFMNRSRVDQLKKYNSDKNTGINISGDDYADDSEVFVKKRKF